MATIDRIDLYTLNSNSPLNHIVYPVVKKFDANKHRILLRVDNIIYDVLDTNSSKKIYLPMDPKKGFQNALSFSKPELKTVTIYAQLYDYQKDVILDTKKQDFTEAPFFKMYNKTGVITSTLANTFSTYWNKTRRVEKVEGPFTTAECTTLATDIKTDVKYYFAATPKQYLNPTELVLMKWQYRYDDGEFTDFNYAIETQNGLKNVMSCTFHKNPSKIQVYAFFKKPSDDVSVVLDTSGYENTESQNQGSQEVNNINNTNNITLAEAKVRAFMRMLRVKEGTKGDAGYTKLFGGENFTKPPHNKTMKTHPNIDVPYGDTSSSAAGAYQIMYFTYKDLTGYYMDTKKKWVYSLKKDMAKKYNITSFDQESQDKFCLSLLKHAYTSDRAKSFYDPKFYKGKGKDRTRDLAKEAKAKKWRSRFKGQQGDIIQMILDDDIKRAALVSSLCWASLPDSPYGQQSKTYTFEDVKKIYEEFLKEELEGKQSFKTYLKPGFLKEFGYELENRPKPNVTKSNSQESPKVDTKPSDFNEYKIHIDQYKVEKTKTNVNSDKYVYLICEKNNIINTFELERNKYKLLPFPQKGTNWGRYGTRDKGGDNWIREEVCAAFLGFFYTLPKNNYNDYLYYNDISANDKRNIGHEGHKVGNDIDIRYPGSGNGGQTFWYDAKKKFKNEAEFVKVLENILGVAVKWGFNKNYAYKKSIKHTTGKALSVHQDHFHIGLR